MNFMVYPIGMLGYWICGFALQMGGVGAVAALGGDAAARPASSAITLFGKTFGLFGAKGFFLSGDVYDVGVFALFLFQMVFMDTAATIPTGAMAERWKCSSFVVFGFFMSMVVYPLFGNWVWGGGWLADLGANFGLGHGHVDFAGSSVVHMVGGVAALAGAIVLGPRIGKFDKDGKPVAIPGHHIPMAHRRHASSWPSAGSASTRARRSPAATCASRVVATNTMLAGAGGALAAMLYMMWRFGKPDPSMMANGMLAGLVAITAPCAFVTAPVGGAHRRHRRRAGRASSVFFVERTLKIDDPVGAISVHGVNGAWGVLCARPLRRRHLRRRLERRRRHGEGPVLRRRQPVRGAAASAPSPASCSCSSSFYVFFKVRRRDHRQPRVAPRPRSKGSTCPRWARSPTPSSACRRASARRARSSAPGGGKRAPERRADPAARRGHGAPLRCPDERTKE